MVSTDTTMGAEVQASGQQACVRVRAVSGRFTNSPKITRTIMLFVVEFWATIGWPRSCPAKIVASIPFLFSVAEHMQLLSEDQAFFGRVWVAFQ